MKILFYCAAALILFIYAPYFYYILSGKSTKFEDRLKIELQQLLAQIKAGAVRNVYPIIFLALMLEAAYFVSAWSSIDNIGFRWLTLAFAAFEVLHLARTVYFFRSFMRDKSGVERLIIWKLERFTVLVFFAHAIIGLVLLVLP